MRRRKSARAAAGILCLTVLLCRLRTASAEKPYICPLPDGTLTDTFGAGRGHGGIDLAAPAGTEIYAAADGIVETAGWEKGYGNYIILRHEDGFRTLYGHCAALLVTQETAVHCGDCIALVGETGDATGPHLHFEVRAQDTRLDPAAYVRGIAYAMD